MDRGAWWGTVPGVTKSRDDLVTKSNFETGSSLVSWHRFGEARGELALSEQAPFRGSAWGSLPTMARLLDGGA